MFLNKQFNESFPSTERYIILLLSKPPKEVILMSNLLMPFTESSIIPFNKGILPISSSQ